MSTPLRVGVVGVGHHGRHHARVLADLPDVVLSGVVDADLDRARELAVEYNTHAFADPSHLLGRVDAVSVAVPTVHHFPVAQTYLSRGIGTLVEKPMAYSTAEAREMVRLAHKNAAILQVGHIERFNPVWEVAETLDAVPTYIETQRFSPYPFRSLDVSVVFDVMIHDLDLIMALANAPLESVDAVGGSLASPSPDRAEVRLSFANGVQATASASRVHHRPVRSMRLWHANGAAEIDFLNRSAVTSTYVAPAEGLSNAALTSEQQNLLRERMFPKDETTFERSIEPLRRELEHFVDCVRHHRQPKVDGEQGCDVVALASRIDQMIAASQTLPMRKSA